MLPVATNIKIQIPKTPKNPKALNVTNVTNGVINVKIPIQRNQEAGSQGDMSGHRSWTHHISYRN